MYHTWRETSILSADCNLEELNLKFTRFNKSSERIRQFIEFAKARASETRTRRVEQSEIKVRFFNEKAEKTMKLCVFSDPDLYVPTKHIVQMFLSKKLLDVEEEEPERYNKLVLLLPKVEVIDPIGHRRIYFMHWIECVRFGVFKVLSVSGIANILFKLRARVDVLAKYKLYWRDFLDDDSLPRALDCIIEEHVYHIVAGEAAKHDAKFRSLFEKIGIAEVPVVLLVSNKQRIEQVNIYKCKLCSAILLGYGHAVMHYYAKHENA